MSKNKQNTIERYTFIIYTIIPMQSIIPIFYRMQMIDNISYLIHDKRKSPCIKYIMYAPIL